MFSSINSKFLIWYDELLFSARFRLPFMKDSTRNVNKSNRAITRDVLVLNSIFIKKVTMTKVFSHPERDPLFATGAYSDCISIDGFLFVSGQAAVDFTTSAFILGTIEEETTRTLENIKVILLAAGATMKDIVKCTVHLQDINEFERYNKVYASYFPGIKPARTTVQSVLAEGIKVEIDCIAKIPQ